MRCLGCAAKTSHQVLQAAMQDAVALAVQKGADPDLMPPSGLETDSASLPAPPVYQAGYSRLIFCLKLCLTHFYLVKLQLFTL